MGKAKKENKTEFIKVIYFDEEAAQDYLDILMVEERKPLIPKLMRKLGK